ncbi:hypothetical protein BDV96DRAFT_488715 [Lophiotrema nucula]|uniref:Glycoprotease family-domain-containing protein n=1 Tax=Lophiotrema nucula TaxID=690887 RepID=A0A6A5ZGT6_9PLEO|nr:hypothetical protein BDV96DRAFT_488715 [Lophiotrema nucula]
MSDNARQELSESGEQHVPVYFNGTYILPQTTYGKDQWESDAQIAARRAMAKRSSRSYAARVSRARSRKKELLGKPAKPGITLDTSFTRHRGNEPRQLYPEDVHLKGGNSVKKSAWFGRNKSMLRTKGLGITKGTPLPGRQPEEYVPTVTNLGNVNAGSQPNKEPQTAASTPGSKTWEISPSDRPIPIGISIPSDSVPDFSPYQTTRQRSESDATLVTPSIIITPAAAMKSVWSPDTDYASTPGRSSSIYSRADLNVHSTAPDAPPVPALPTDLLGTSREHPAAAANQNAEANSVSHARNGTLDSAVTAFEEDDDLKRKDRITSSATYFEEDETPLRDRRLESNLSLDTTVVPTPRRSRGWWNVITTPFEFSRSNSVWTQGGRNPDRTPDVPAVPRRFDEYPGSPATPSTYIWSATERSPSTQGDSPLAKQMASSTDRDVTSPLSARSASPILGTAALGTVLMPRQVSDEPRAINVNIELLDRRPPVTTATAINNSPPSNPARQAAHASPQFVNVDLSTPGGNTLHKSPPQFEPPPTFAKKSSPFSYGQESRASSPVSTDLKEPKKHRKVTKFMDWLPFGRRGQKSKKQDKNKKSKRRRWCCICCCCLIFLVLLAIIVPVTVVLTRRHNNDSKAQDPPSQWLNLTGYPPIPTGISTIAQPEAIVEESGCIQPATVWSCALPKEQQKDIEPNKPDQPNFKLNIVFQNGTISDPSKTRPARRAPNAVSAGSLVRSRFLNLRAAPSASPAPPSIEDQQFMGKTTDKISSPFEGEDTPFFINFLDATQQAASRLLRRADPTNVTSSIPPPDLNPDGTAAPANLYPLTSGQPLRLFNRGTADEHYGFYIYYDRSIFLKSIQQNFTRGGNPADVDGGSPFDAATLRCTWKQTRFLVQIWTNSQTSKPLLNNAPSNSSSTFKRPGSFPYPVTVTIDRHGGTVTEKMAYCYGMEKDGTIPEDSKNKTFLLEDRAFGGTLVNPGKGFSGNVSGTIDGGTGGCSCQWQNWLA